MADPPPTSTSSLQTSPLLSLSGELRNMIFEYVAYEPEWISNKFLLPGDAPPQPSLDNKLQMRILSSRIGSRYLIPLLQTCQQLRVEWKSYLSSKIEFAADLHDMNKISKHWILGGGVDGDPNKAYGNFAIDMSHPWIDDLDIVTMLRTYLAVNATKQKLNFRF
ncbi:hypothetical protein NX059_012041 [Plenodomus lindquistii]|nr:hypothetical protein NX059_012041 [Plenodomus lindquistii]